MDAKELGQQSVGYRPDISDHDRNYYQYGSDGLTLRQHYAGLAMQGLLSCGQAHDEFTASVTANASVAIADALLAELAKEPQP